MVASRKMLSIVLGFLLVLGLAVTLSKTAFFASQAAWSVLSQNNLLAPQSAGGTDRPVKR